MGTAGVQGELWGARARDWSELAEPVSRSVYDAVFARTGIGPGTKLLDIGCGAGGALVAARELGAEVTGLDAASNLVEIARSRLPGARIEIGEMEDLPFADESFDVVTGFNSFQFAGDPVEALREARRVCKPGGSVVMLVWGKPEECDTLRATVAAVMALLPPAPGAPGPAALSEEGVIENMMEQAGLAALHSGDVDCPFLFLNVDAAC